MEVWSLILRHVSPSDRLWSCSRVSQRFRAAAQLATDSICVMVRPCRYNPWKDNYPALETYLDNRATQLTSLEVQRHQQRVVDEHPVELPQARQP